MKGLIPSPTCGIRKLLSQHFNVIDTPEDYTTKLCSKCKIGHMKSVMKTKVRKKVQNGKEIEWIEKEMDVHGLRHCNNKKCAVLMNRDYNAAINIRQNLIHYLHHQKWSPHFITNQTLNQVVL